MVAHGVTRARLPAGNEVVCTLRDPRTAELAGEIGNTRSAAAIELVGRAPRRRAWSPSATRRPRCSICSKCSRDGAPKPAAIIGMPVGFVGAAESKDALAENTFGMPFAIVRGRMGGSAMTAAAVNAIGEGRPVNASQPAASIGVGTGPGDPELLTLKAVRALGEADVLAHFAKRGNNGNARAIVAAHLRPDDDRAAAALSRDHRDRQGSRRLQVGDRRLLRAVGRARSPRISTPGARWRCCREGDPLFYGSYMHLHVRLAHRFPTEVIPGVTAMSGCWSATGLPIVQGDDVLSVLPGTMSRSRADAPACRHRRRRHHEGRPQPAEDPPRACRRPASSTRPSMSSAAPWPTAVSMRLADKADDDAPYFSIVLVPGWEARP